MFSTKKKLTVFFFGILSTPLPYLLLAAIYFFGFAMGVFNNVPKEEPVNIVSSLTITHETTPQIADQSAYHYQSESTSGIFCQEALKSESTDLKVPIYIEKIHFRDVKLNIPDFLYTSFRFSRPPPAGC